MYKPMKRMIAVLPVIALFGCSSTPEVDPTTTMLLETKTAEMEVVLQEVTFGGFMDAKDSSEVESKALKASEKGSILEEVEDLADDLDVEIVEGRYQYGKFYVNEGSLSTFLLSREHSAFLDRMKDGGVVSLNDKGNELFSFEVKPVALGKKASLGITVHNSSYDQFLSGKVVQSEVTHDVEVKYEYNYALFMSTGDNKGVMMVYRMSEPETYFAELPIASAAEEDPFEFNEMELATE